MSISFKIFVEGLEKTVLAKGDLVSYKNDYPKLFKNIKDKSNAPLFKRSGKQIKDSGQVSSAKSFKGAGPPDRSHTKRGTV